MHSVWHICQFELTRLFLTKRGAILLLAFAIIWAMVFKYPVLEAASLISNQNFSENISAFSETLNLGHLVSWSYAELAVYWLFAVFAFPVTAILMSSDQLASDTNRGTLRFLLLRTSRNQLLIGRFLGQLLILVSLIAMTLFAAFMLGVSRESSLATSALPAFGFVGINLLLIGMPFIAVTSLLNIILKSSKLSIVMIIIVIPIFHSVISYLSSLYDALDWLLYALPGIQLIDALQMPNMELSPTTLIPLVQTIAYLAMAQQLLARRAL